MGKVATGAKAGVASGVVYGSISAVFGYMTLVLMKEEIISMIAATLPSDFPITTEQLYSIALIGVPASFVAGIIIGVILGLIYGWAYDRIPGRTAVAKGLVIGIVLWVIVSVLLGSGNLQLGITYYLTSLGVGLVSALIFGVLLGFFYGKFTPSEVY